MWQAYKRHYGKDGDPVLVWIASTPDMNPTFNLAEIERAKVEDEANAEAEYMAEFRKDIEGYISRDAVEGCVAGGVYELPFIATGGDGHRNNYMGFVDPSGGAQDSFTLAVAHKENGKAVLDCVRETRPPLSPEKVIEEYAKLLRDYRIGRVYGDRYGGEFPREIFRRYEIVYEPAVKPKAEIYRDFLPLVNSGKVELLDNPRLIAQLCNLERRVARGGRDSIDHAPNAHDDVANVAAGALTMASRGREPGDYGWS